jgi:hypothetical protein
MSLGSALIGLDAFSPDRQLERLQQEIPAELIEEALQVTGKASVKKRKLPAELAIWLVIGMALFRDFAIAEVVKQLGLALPDKGGKNSVARSVTSDCRGRLGAEPVKWLFRKCAEIWSRQTQPYSMYRGLKLVGMDGVLFRVADSTENRAHFGAHHNGQAASGYPLCRMVGLFILGSHVIIDAVFGPHTTSEHVLSKSLWEQVLEKSIVIVDRLFRCSNLLIPLERMGGDRFWLTRAPEKRNWQVVEVLGPGDFIVEVKIYPQQRALNPSLPPTWRFRVVEYQRKGFRPSALCTSLLDPKQFPANELADLYHHRWEIELAYDELKTEMLERQETLRSKTPERVAQEIWGLLLAFNLVRVEMTRVAAKANVSPNRISFVGALRLMQLLWLVSAHSAPGRLPDRLAQMEDDIQSLVLPERRERSYPRQVKAQARKYSQASPC